MNNTQKLPSTDELLKEREDLLKFLDQSQQQILLSQQRIAFLNGVLTERGVDLTAEQNKSAEQAIKAKS